VACANVPRSVDAGGGAATRFSFERHAPQVNLLHLVCHGMADLRTPLDSGLLMAGNVRIMLRDLFNLRLKVRLAVLSACETALPGVELPDEVVALPTGLLQAGVAGVVASQWSVPDLATAMLMVEFYRRWGLGHRARPAAALRAAQCWLRDTTNAQKRREWEAALAAGEAWLPASVGQMFLDELEFEEDEQLLCADPHRWAAFAHVGA
jgi:CHAT domain-containing protein